MFSISKAKRLIGFLFRVFKEADEPFLSKLYKAIVLPHLEYCSCVWDPPFTKYITALERVQSFAARVVTNTWPLESAPLVESLQWPSLSQRRYFQKLCLCRRILCGFSIIPPSFFPLSTRPLSSHKNSFPLYLFREDTTSQILTSFRKDTSSQILLQTLRGVHLEQSSQ